MAGGGGGGEEGEEHNVAFTLLRTTRARAAPSFTFFERTIHTR